MADDNKPQHLDPSDHSGDETTTHHRTTTDETRALPEISDEGTENANAPLDDVASDAQASQDAAPDEGADEPVEDAQPAETVTEEVDPETRMLQQIAALKSGDQTADDAASDESADERSAADADSQDIVSADASEDE